MSRGTKHETLAMTLNGSWQKLAIPDYFLGYQIENRVGNHDIERKFGETGTARTFKAEETDQDKVTDLRYPFREEIYVKGTASEIVDVEVEIFNDQTLP